jgi:hypothetical protein
MNACGTLYDTLTLPTLFELITLSALLSSPDSAILMSMTR